VCHASIDAQTLKWVAQVSILRPGCFGLQRNQGGKTADLSTSLRFGRDDKGKDGASGEKPVRICQFAKGLSEIWGTRLGGGDREKCVLLPAFTCHLHFGCSLLLTERGGNAVE
jgi:hypothetical protein